MADLRNIVFDCAHPASLARFWAAALSSYEVAPYDDAELARLRANGIFDIEDDPSVLVQPVDGAAGPRLLFMRVPDGKVGEPRAGRHMHLDLRPADRSRDDEVVRLKEIGATEYEDHREPDGTGWVTMADPEGNLFCVEQAAPGRLAFHDR
jgi:glyoxalase superfamily protein